MANSKKTQKSNKGKADQKAFQQAFTAPFTPVKQYEDGKTRPYHPQNPRKQA